MVNWPFKILKIIQKGNRGGCIFLVMYTASVDRYFLKEGIDQLKKVSTLERCTYIHIGSFSSMNGRTSISFQFIND